MIFGNPDTFAIYVDRVKYWLLDQEVNGIVGIYLNGKFFSTNYGLVSFYNEFEDVFKKIDCIPCNQHVFDLPDVEILKFMLMERYPNWCANSEDEWEENLENWNEVEENIKFDLSLYSFSRGHAGSFHLFGVKSLDDKLKLVFYTKNDLKDFFDFSLLNVSNIWSVIINFNDYIILIHELILFLENNGVSIKRDN
ncbi:Immunity protein 42 [Moraxella cuniculi DSM 21768]|uniref:Immunity protein 42 n=1 Tax=Moraxella cuniculi DSM 21768 TaxID=1122245 RepID=A0A1N7G977_9GAMM|nr:Imm42 family immunity protein [Moraxella cuniculi]OOS01766.1 hypothetical protein B0189_11030 [Moraxella cuniculi]SIS09130.1 Immunity protein 42 [Moraxella cuniculi DSM 21768]